MRKGLFFHFLAFSLLGALLAHSAPANDGSTDARVDEIFATWDSTQSPGCALAVMSDGAIINSRGYGMANLEHGIAISPSSVFYVGSVSKQFVAMAIALLAEEGKIDLDDDIRKYVPEIPEYDRTITIRQMVHHTSGLRDYLTLMSLSGRSFADSVTEEEVIALLSRQRALNFDPGDEHLYSNSGYFLLAVIVKRASNKPLREYAAEKIFEPLGMHNSHFHDDYSMFVENRAEGHLAEDNGGWGLTRSRFALVGSGGLFTTVEDLSRWDQNFYDNRLGKGKPSLLETMHSCGTLNDGETLQYAFGLTVGEYRGLDTVRHGGALGGYRAHLVRFPKERFSVAIECNLDDIDPGSLANHVADIYLADKLEPKAAPAQPAAAAKSLSVEAYIGDYELQPGSVITFKKENDHLVARISDDELELAPQSENEFVAKGMDARIVFERDDTGKVTGLVLHRGDRRDEATRLPDAPSDAMLAGYAGEFWSDELQVTYRLFMEEGDLFLRIGWNPRTPLRLLSEDVLYRPGNKMTIERNENRRVTGFTLDAGRVRNLKFVKQ